MKGLAEEITAMSHDERQKWFDSHIKDAKIHCDNETTRQAFYMLGVVEAIFDVRIRLHDE